ncbi:MAG: ribosome biogenesis factor YjgA [Serpentinimonas sp.]|nr:ribosome biogenesis factor YjgA [Serpentinimonas sp.]
MARKPTKGYYVKGHFVAEGSELDQELKRELKGDTETSRTDLKKHSAHLQQLGEQLLTLRSALLDRLALPSGLLDALSAAQRITDFEGRRRQIQYIGKLMRRLDPATVQAVEQALAEQHHGSAADTLRLHQAEQWRVRLLADDEALNAWLQIAPQTDLQHLRTLIRQARKDAQAQASAERAGQAVRHSKSFREIYQLLRAGLEPPEADAGIDPDADALSSRTSRPPAQPQGAA